MEELIDAYIAAYNRMDVAGMLDVLHDDIAFENVSNTDGVLTVHGKAAFTELACRSVELFAERMQLVRSIVLGTDTAAVEVDYHATLAHDLSDEKKAGDTLVLRGVSFFRFKDGKISQLTDYS